MTFKTGHKHIAAGQGEGIKFLRAHVSYEGDTCLIWPLHRNPISGYGSVSLNGKIYYAHRFMCELVNGPAPTPKHQCAHSCGKGHTGCIHPKHLSWKTLGENQKDRRLHGTVNRPDWWKGRVGSKLTTEQVAEIRAVTGPKTVPILAAKFGVTESTIRHVRAGRTWRQTETAPVERST